MATDPETRTTRRTVMTAALGAASAFAASAIVGTSPVAATPNGSVQIGAGVSDSDDDAAAETRVVGTTAGAPRRAHERGRSRPRSRTARPR